VADAFTAKSFPIAKAPKRLTLLGDKTKRPEPAQHIIEFPGGAIEVSRCSDGSYWAHILVTQQNVCEDLLPGRAGCYGVVVDSRVQRADGSSVDSIERKELVEQIAVLIRPSRVAPGEPARQPAANDIEPETEQMDCFSGSQPGGRDV
jgi:hypothetical protein